jgi:hypothetical protein
MKTLDLSQATAAAHAGGRPDRAEAMKATHANAAAYDKWLREQVQEAINDPRPTIAHEA